MIQIMDVKKSFGAEEVLHGITREFEPGKIHGIVGNNGSGKTVLMKCIADSCAPLPAGSWWTERKWERTWTFQRT